MGGNLFDYIAGAASILSFILALLPYFQKYRQPLAFSFAFTLGMLVGSLVARTSASSVFLSFQGSVFQVAIIILAIVCAAAVVLIILSFALSSDADSEAAKSKGIAGGASATFFLVLCMVYGVSSCSVPSGHGVDEQLALAKYYEDTKNFGQAVTYYRQVLDQENRSQFKDPELIKTLNEKINQLLKTRRELSSEPSGH